MAIENSTWNIIWVEKGRHPLFFRDIKQFNGRIIHLEIQEGSIANCGSWATVLPISPIDWRKQHSESNKASIKASQSVEYFRFDITDDWNEKYALLIHFALTETIKKACEDVKETFPNFSVDSANFLAYA